MLQRTENHYNILIEYSQFLAGNHVAVGCCKTRLIRIFLDPTPGVETRNQSG